MSCINATKRGGEIMPVDVERLDEIIEQRNTKQRVAELIGVNRSTFYRKLKGEGKGFSVEEAQKITAVVPLSGEEAVQIFFGKKVAKTLQKEHN